MKNRDRIHLYHSEDDMDKSSLGAYEQKLKMLLYEWEKVYTYGDAESMCTDGIILNRYRKLFCMSKKQREQTGVMEIYGKVHSLLNAVSEDNLVVMRELGVSGMLRDQIQESVKKVRSIPLRTTEIPKKQAVKMDEDWQIQG